MGEDNICFKANTGLTLFKKQYSWCWASLLVPVTEIIHPRLDFQTRKRHPVFNAIIAVELNLTRCWKVRRALVEMHYKIAIKEIMLDD